MLSKLSAYALGSDGWFGVHPDIASLPKSQISSRQPRPQSGSLDFQVGCVMLVGDETSVRPVFSHDG